MNRATVVALTLALAVSASTKAHAFPHFGIHRAPVVRTMGVADDRITLHLTYNGPSFEDVMVAGHIYTLQRNETIAIKAPVGTPVYTESTGHLHTKGAVLFAVTPEMQNKTVEVN